MLRTVAWIIAFYPRGWRERYQDEMLALLEQHTITLKTIFDLLLGAFDAQLDPSYRTREGLMFQRFHDVRFLAYIYVFALSIFLVAVNCWALTINSFSFWFTAFSPLMPFAHSAPTGITIAGPIIVMIICFFSLIGSTFSILRAAFKSRSFGVVLFALCCLGLASILVYPTLDGGIVGLIVSGITVLVISVSFFVTGIKGLKLLRNRQSSPLLFALVIDFVVPAVLLLYQSLALSFWPNAFITWESTMRMLGQCVPYISIGALLLALADVSLSRRSWYVIRGIGSFLTLLLAVEVVLVVGWDVSCWLAGNRSNELILPLPGIWAPLSGQGLLMLMANALILVVLLTLAVVALLRAFAIHPDRREVISRRLAV